tara:strand:+ start:6471 stop:7154 length:684 start_codon:yes stop_codon:yes gene_type:complete
MIIEFTGIPGAGKSTIINGISELSLKIPIIFNVEKYIRDRSFFKLPGTIGFDIILFFNFYKLKRKDYLLLSRSLTVLKKNNNRILHKINILRNIFKKLVINRFIQNKKEYFLIDEGLSHIPMSLFVDINSEIIKSEVIDFFKNLPKIDKLLLIDADDLSLIKRVTIRGGKGHKRIDFSKKENVVLFMSKSRDILDLLKQELRPDIYMNMNTSPDIQNIIKLIGLRNV